MNKRQNEADHADDCAYQLGALLRTIEIKARDLSVTMEPGPLMQPLSDIANLCEVAGMLAAVVHEALQNRAGA